MNAQELRIGNLIGRKEKMTTFPTDFETICCTLQDIENIQNGSNNYDYASVFISEEWLLKMPQFKKSQYFDYKFEYKKGEDYSEGKMFIEVDFNTRKIQLSICVGGDNSNWVYLPMPEFLHIFQNLFHALTNEELTIKN